MGTERTYTIGEVARELGVAGKNSSTIRLWTETFADWLSPLTRPDKGQLRLYTGGDLAMLEKVRDLRRQHLSYDEIRLQLANGHAQDGEAGMVMEESEADPQPSQPAVGEVEQTVRVEIEALRDALAPLRDVAGAMGRYSRDYDRLGYRLQVEFTRLEGAIDSLGQRLDGVQAELVALRVNLRPTQPPAARSEGPASDEGKASPQQVTVQAMPPGSASLRADGAAQRRPSLVSEAHMLPAGRRYDPAVEPPDTERSSPPAATINEYGLRPFPPRLAVRSLGTQYLCKFCGSATKPLGVTPTSRAVLACIECGERTSLPLTTIERTLGFSAGFWARLWRLLKSPFSR